MSTSVENIESQLNEIEFLESLYDSVKVSPHNVIAEFQSFVDGKLDDVYNQITCTVTIKEVHPPVEIEVTLPHSYPHKSLRFGVFVRGHSDLNKRVQDLIASFQNDHELGTFLISSVIDFVKENLESTTSEKTIELPESCDCRVWLVSHHIYDKVKRKKLLELSVDKSLGGFTLPGKPGVICLEGDSKNCSEAVAIIKSWNWQRIRVKFEEKTVKRKRFNGFFEELTCYKASQTGGDRPHMDLGVFQKYLEQHDLGFAFKEIFELDSK